METLDGVRSSLRAWQRELFSATLPDLTLRFTLLALLLRPVGDWTVRPFVLLLACLGLVSPRVLRSPYTWLILTVLTGWRVVADWPLSDNHAYLLCYWCLALACSLLATDVRASMALNGRLLIGLTFLLATLWKALLSPDYINGTFFRVTLLTDPRFADVGLLIGQLTDQQLTENRAFLEPDLSGGRRLNPPELSEPPAIRQLAQAATWWTVIMEALVALSFLMPTRSWCSRQRHAALLVFCGVTYVFAPVDGFGRLLLVMGLAQCEPTRHGLQSAYLATFFLVTFYGQIPFMSLIAR